MNRYVALAAAGLVAVAGSSASAETASTKWEDMPLMQLEARYRGPFKDTMIQRWRDPIDGTICYLYLPIALPNAKVGKAGYLQYGANIIGSIACLPGRRG